MDHNQVVKVVETKKTSEGKSVDRLVQEYNANGQIVREFLYRYDFRDGAEFLWERRELKYTATGKIKLQYKFTGHYPSSELLSDLLALDSEQIKFYEYDASGRVIQINEKRINMEEESGLKVKGTCEYITVFEYSEDGIKIGKRYPAEFYNDPHYCGYITEYYDKAERLVCEDWGNLKKYWDYDDSGNLILEHWISDTLKEDDGIKSGIDTPIFRYEYDECGNQIAYYAYSPKNREQILHEKHFVYNEKNQEILCIYEIADGLPRDWRTSYEYEVAIHDINPDEIHEPVFGTDDRVSESGQLLMLKATNGDAATIAKVAENYRSGDNGFPADNELAFKWCKKGLEQDAHNAELWVQLARCHKKAGTNADMGAAHKAYRCAAALGHIPSMYIVAEDLYYDSDERKRPECLPWLEKAVAAQDEAAEALLGYIYLKGELQTNDRKRGIDLLRRSAEHGDPQGARILAEAYLHQIDGSEEAVPYVASNAAKYFAMAVENGEDSHKALYYAGPAFFYGEGVAKDMKKARQCIEALIDDECLPGEKIFDLLGCMCFEGAGGVIDYKLGEKAFRRAIKGGDAETSLAAASNLGMYFLKYTNRMSEAIQLLQSSADKGNTDAQVNLGKAYYDGKGVPKNWETAAYYFGLAAKQGNQAAIDNLQVMGASNGFVTNNEPAAQARERHPIRGAIIGYFVGGFLGAILHLFWPGAEWISMILGVIIGALKG